MRIYLPGISDVNKLNDRTWNDSTVSAYTTSYGEVQGAMVAIPSSAGGGYDQVFYRFRNNPLKAEILTPDQYLVQPIIAVQRRRNRKAAHR